MTRNTFCRLSVDIPVANEDGSTTKKVLFFSSFINPGSERYGQKTQANRHITFNKSPFTNDKDFIWRGEAGIKSVSVTQKSFFTKELKINWACPDPNDFEKIINQDWKEKDQLVTELGAKNVIYFLLDEVNKLIYVGETGQDLKVRLSDREHYKNAGIPYWTHYRFEVLPSNIDTKARRELENMTIRAYATLFSNTKDINSFNISSYKLVNRKIRN